MPEHVLCIWSSSSPNGRRNLLFGLDTQTWGFKDFDPQYAEAAEWVLFGHDHSGGSPRMDLEDWQTGTLDILLCQLTVPLYTATAPHWPDEVEQHRVIYPHRIGIAPVARLTSTSASPDGPLSAASMGLRTAGITNRGARVQMDMGWLMREMDVSTIGGPDTRSSAEPDLSRTSGAPRPAFPVVRGRRGAGRSSDPEFTKAVEKRAVELATAHMQSLDWPDIEELGKPYDLVCRRPSGEEKHVEVKGTSGAGAEVEYTYNEVEHFRSCPYGADLIVVRDISVDRSVHPYVATGGTVHHVQEYRAPAADLQATRWLGRVPQPEAQP